MTESREFDVILWGATGFTGQLAAAYLAGHPQTKRIRWALGGRDRAKLEAVRGRLAEKNPSLASLPLVVGDSRSANAMYELAGRTRVVASLVGPFARYGSELVAACVEQGTHYCDITGEVQWVRSMIDRHHERARQSGARIVHCCGFDSIPSDLGVWMLQNYAQEHFGARCDRVTLLVSGSHMGLSGGTVDSMVNIAEQSVTDRDVLRTLADPYSLDPAGARGTGPNTDRPLPTYDRTRRVWTAPFIMALINTRVVRRSNALLGHPYGRAMRYEERMPTGPGAAGLLRAAAVSGLQSLAPLALRVSPVRRVLQRFVLPKPGEGPAPEKRAKAFFRIELCGRSADGSVALKAVVAAQGDPGYDETAKMIGESALCLALDKLRSEGGVLTPAVAMGAPLLDRLRAAGHTYVVEVESVSQARLAEHMRRQQAAQLVN